MGPVRGIPSASKGAAFLRDDDGGMEGQFQIDPGLDQRGQVGRAGDLVLPDGRRPLPPAKPAEPGPERGSVVVALATDLPLESRQLMRVARRCGAGLARLGAFWGHGSGDIAVAFSTAQRLRHHETTAILSCAMLDEQRIDLPFQAAAEATQEAVLNAMLAAPATRGRDGHVRPGLAEALGA